MRWIRRPLIEVHGNIPVPHWPRFAAQLAIALVVIAFLIVGLNIVLELFGAPVAPRSWTGYILPTLAIWVSWCAGKSYLLIRELRRYRRSKHD